MAAFFHRKILQKSMKPKVVIREEYCIYYPCDGSLELPPLSSLLPPPPPPPLSTLSSSHPLSLYLIILFCGLAVSFSFICYLTLSTIYRRRQRNRENMDEIHEEFVNEDHGPVLHHHPIWLINTIGLEQSQIDSIHVVKYKKDEGLIEGTDCSVCLSEFEDDESLRLLPKCSHAFHVPCIDTWLRSHKNCPLCRAPIIKNTTDNQTDHHATIEMNSIESSTREETEGEDSETIDHHVAEEESNGDMEKPCSGVRVQSDLADRHRLQDEEFVPTRRSVSMDEFSASIVQFAVARHSSRQLVVSKKPMVNSMPKGGHKLKGSSSSISIRSRLMKSSSIGHSSRKATSFRQRSYSSSGKGSHNRSY